MGYEYVDWSMDRWANRLTPAGTPDLDYWNRVLPARRSDKTLVDEIDACIADFERQMREGR
jgi:hypothetical protein